MVNDNNLRRIFRYSRDRETPEERKAKQLYDSLLKKIKEGQLNSVNNYRNDFRNFRGLYVDLQSELEKYKKYVKAKYLNLYDKIREQQLSHFKNKATFLPNKYFKSKYGINNESYNSIIKNAVDPYKNEAKYIVKEYTSKIFKAKLKFLKQYRSGVIKTVRNPNKPYNFSDIVKEFKEKVKAIDEPYGYRFVKKYKPRALMALMPLEKKLKKTVDTIRKQKK